MRLASILVDDREQAAIRLENGPAPLEAVNRELGLEWPTDLQMIIESGQLGPMNDWFQREGRERLEERSDLVLPGDRFRFAPLYRRPGKIWGIGLNYAAHAADLSEVTPTSMPASFMKPYTTLIGQGDEILLPGQSERTTGEAELGLVIGQTCKDVERADWLGVVAGFTTIIDMTAEDILKLNPRYLTVCKSFDTFFSFGPELVTPDEIDDVLNLTVQTVVNGETMAENVVSNMTFPPDYLVSFHSRVMTLMPGDVISTGTPGAALLKDGDEIQCRITGFESLTNPVRDLKASE